MNTEAQRLFHCLKLGACLLYQFAGITLRVSRTSGTLAKTEFIAHKLAVDVFLHHHVIVFHDEICGEVLPCVEHLIGLV